MTIKQLQYQVLEEAKALMDETDKSDIEERANEIIDKCDELIEALDCTDDFK